MDGMIRQHMKVVDATCMKAWAKAFTKASDENVNYKILSITPINEEFSHAPVTSEFVIVYECDVDMDYDFSYKS